VILTSTRHREMMIRSARSSMLDIATYP